MSYGRRTVGLLVAACAVATPFLPSYAGAAAAPDRARGCPGDRGVTVVVDYRELGDGVRADCLRDGGGVVASALFPDAGFPLRFTTRDPSFVCRVAGVPDSDPCVHPSPPDAYWALWWSDGSGEWSYAQLGATGLTVPDGGYVAFVWQDSPDRVPPRVDPDPRLSPATADDEVAVEAPPADDGDAEEADPDGGLPAWVPLGAVVLVGGAGVVVALRRRDRR